jgi:hypothetical protein
MSKEKFIGFPKAYALSLAEGTERRESFIQQCNDLGIDHEVYIVERYPNCGTKLKESNLLNHTNWVKDNTGEDRTVEMVVTANHFKMWRHWLQTSDSEWAIFCEDDVDFKSTSQYWTFDWKSFQEIVIPKDANVVQLCILSDEISDLTIKRRHHQYYGANAYLVKREYAEKIIERYSNPNDPNEWCLRVAENIKVGSWVPCFPEDFLYLNDDFDRDVVLDEGFYSIPLFTEKFEFGSFFDLPDREIRPNVHMRTIQMWKDYEQEVLSWNK